MNPPTKRPHTHTRKSIKIKTNKLVCFQNTKGFPTKKFVCFKNVIL